MHFRWKIYVWNYFSIFSFLRIRLIFFLYYFFLIPSDGFTLVFPMTSAVPCARASERSQSPVCMDFRVLRICLRIELLRHTHRACSVFLFIQNENKHECRPYIFFLFFLCHFLLLILEMSFWIVFFAFEAIWRYGIDEISCVFAINSNEIQFFFRLLLSVCQEHLDAYHSLGNARFHQRIQLLRIKSFCLLDEHASFVTTSTSYTYDK